MPLLEIEDLHVEFPSQAGGVLRAVEGVSLVTTYRTTFKSEIDRSGFDGLVKLIAKTSDAGGKGR